MATKETRALRGRRRGDMLVARALGEVNLKRLEANVSQHSLAVALGWSESALSRLLAGQLHDLGVKQLSEVASVLGMEISLGLHPVGDPLHDKGQLAAAKRFDKLLSPAWRVTDETLLPGPGERRAWDKLLRLIGATPPYLVGVDIEARIRDVQALVRRTRMRERDGGVGAILIVLSDSATNRRLLGGLLDSLGDGYRTSPRLILKCLREGRALPGSGVLLI